MNKINLCISDIPESAVRTAKNGKNYVELILTNRKETGPNGESHTLYVSQSKDERESGTTKKYVGSGKEINV